MTINHKKVDFGNTDYNTRQWQKYYNKMTTKITGLGGCPQRRIPLFVMGK